MAAGLLVALVPWLKAPVLQATLPLGLRLGALASACCCSVRACSCSAAYRPSCCGWRRTNGADWAAPSGSLRMSTAGSLVGTVSTGFFLIAHVGVARAFFVAGLLLVLLGAVGLVWLRRHWPAALAPLVLLALLPRGELPTVTLADGTQASVVHTQDSSYGTIRVVDYRFAQQHQREMIIDGLVQGGAST